MLYALAIMMVIVWILALMTSFTVGGMIHLLPVVALVALVLRLMGTQNVFVTRK